MNFTTQTNADTHFRPLYVRIDRFQRVQEYLENKKLCEIKHHSVCRINCSKYVLITSLMTEDVVVVILSCHH